MKYYFDNNATTKVDEDVLKEMLPYFSEYYGNPSSIYKFGQFSKQKLETAREDIARILNVKPQEIYFTSGASEANNLILKGIMLSNTSKGKHLITSKIEHPSILNACKNLEKLGFDVTYLDVDEKGIINLEQLKKSIRPDTVLVSIMFANNEIGTIEPIKEIGDICRYNGVLFSTDATCAMGNIRIDMNELNIDSLSFSAHKFYGPKGIGCAVIKQGIKFEPLINGGHQEREKRAGTENVANIIGMQVALNKIYSALTEKNNYIQNLRDYFEEELKKICNVKINGDVNNRLSSTSSITINGKPNDLMVIKLDMMDICVSSGSACSAGASTISHVLLSIGLSKKEAKETIRVSFGKYNTKEEIDYLLKCIKEIVGEI